MALEIIDSGVIYRNLNPGYDTIFAAFPHPVELRANELVCTYQRGKALYATDLTFGLVRSMDGGHTWRDEVEICRPWQDARPYSYHDPFLTKFGDTLVIAAFRTDRSDSDRPLFNDATGGLTNVESILTRSRDGGRTWSPPEVVALPDDGVFTPSSSIIELANGQWFWAFDRWHGFDEPGPYQPRMVAFFSDDEGRSWGNPIDMTGTAAGKGFWHGKVIRLRDDRLFVTYWSAEMSTMENLPVHSAFGSSDGRAWSEPAPTSLPGQTQCPVQLADGTFAVIYTGRELERPGFFVATSTDGRHWDLENQVRLWDATGRATLGVSAPDAYPRSHDTIAFGAPSLIRLENGDLLVAFWCTEMSVTHLRYVRLWMR